MKTTITAFCLFAAAGCVVLLSATLCVCLFASWHTFEKPDVQTTTLSVTVALSFCNGVAIRFVLLATWMRHSCMHIMARHIDAKIAFVQSDSRRTAPGNSLMCMIALFCSTAGRKLLTYVALTLICLLSFFVLT